MKKQLFFLLCFLFVGFKSYGQELITGGNMEDASAWNVYWNTADAKDTGSYEFNYTADAPTAGQGGCYRVTAAGQAANMLWQKVTLTPGHKYELTGAYKYLADTAINVWVEFFITRIKPNGEIAAGLGYAMNTWNKADTVNLDGTFQDNFMLAPNTRTSTIFEISDTVSQTEWYVAIKAGCWNTLGATAPVYDLCIDELSLIDKSLVNAGGNMEDASAWNVYWNTADAKDTGTYEFNYTADVPAAGKGGCYRVTAAGQAANMMWQPVTIIPGHRYLIEGAYKYIADTAINVWVEYFLTRKKPSGEIATGMGYGMNTWAAPDNVNLDGTFQDNFTLANTKTIQILIPDTVTQTEWYLATKAGCWNTLGDTAPAYDLLFDELYMYDLGLEPWIILPIANVVDGTVTDEDDFSGTAKLKWDADSIYMVFEIKDDSITATASSDIWNNDNIEVYFDIQNEKIANWPRTSGWPPAFTNGTDGYFQLRVVPDSAWGLYNGDLAATANLTHFDVEGGYGFTLNFPWDILDSTFVPEAGAEIGFDIWASDNDANPSFRNQISWNANNTLIYVDPASWGVLALSPSGSFYPVPDAAAPSDPTNVAAAVTGSSAVLTWDASTDNRVVQSYIIFNGSTAVDTIVAKLTGNSFTFTGLAAGDYNLAVTAVDVYGNKSKKVKVVATVVGEVGINENSITGIVVYPNPSTGIINIDNAGMSIVTLEVYTIAGNLVKSYVFTSSYRLQLSQGIYILRMKSENNIVVTRAVVK